MKRRNIFITVSFLGSICLLYYLASRIDDIIDFESRGTIRSTCSYHEKLFKDELSFAIVYLKEIEKENHAIKRIFIKSGEKQYPIRFIHGDNWDDFDFIQVGDTISKKANSFLITVNSRYEFVLNYRCKYNEIGNPK